MSVIETFFRDEFTLKRSVTASSTAADTIMTVGVYQGVIQVISDKTQLFDMTRQGKEYELWCGADVDLRANDIVEIGGKTFGVAGVNQERDLEDDIESHIEARIYEV